MQLWRGGRDKSRRLAGIGNMGFVVYASVCCRKVIPVSVRLRLSASAGGARAKRQDSDNKARRRFWRNARNDVVTGGLVDTPLASRIFHLFHKFLVYGRRRQ